MLAFDIEIDGKRFSVAGVEDWSILAFHLNAIKHVSSDEVTLLMGGLTEDDEDDVAHHVRWGERKLPVGSRVTVTIVETNETDAPSDRYRSDREVQVSRFTPEEIEEMERAQWLELKAKFEPDEKTS